jgi:hypothetical protein
MTSSAPGTSSAVCRAWMTSTIRSLPPCKTVTGHWTEATSKVTPARAVSQAIVSV